MTKGTTLTRTGDSKWYIKGTDAGERPEIAAVLVKLSVEMKDDNSDD